MIVPSRHGDPEESRGKASSWAIVGMAAGGSAGNGTTQHM